MFKENNNSINIGDRVRILQDVEMWDGTFTSGHEFTVTYYDSIRGFDLVDDDGRKLLETRFVEMEKV